MNLAFLYHWNGLNTELFLNIHSIRNSVLDNFMIIGTYLGSFWNMPLLVMVMMAYHYFRKTSMISQPFLRASQSQEPLELIVRLLCGYAVAFVFVTILKIIFDMPRPEVVLGNDIVHTLVRPESKHSFPSGHSAFAMLVAAACWSYVKVIRRSFLVFFVIWVAISRIYVGAHFPVDVLAGLLSGLVSDSIGKIISTKLIKFSTVRIAINKFSKI